MRKLIVVEYVSLDGVIQAPGHAAEEVAGGFARGGWTGPFLPDHRRYNTELYQTAGAFLLGRLTYEIFAAYWPTVTNPDDQIARALNALPKLWLHPVVVGGGKRLFRDGGPPAALRLVDSRTTTSGLVILTYQAQRGAGASAAAAASTP